MEGYVSGIYEYLIKSCGGIAVGRTYLDRGGFLNDRKFVVMDTDNVFLSQRDFPRMAMIRPHLEVLPQVPLYEVGKLVMNAPRMPELRILFSPKDQIAVQEGRVWDDSCMVVDQGEKASTWFSEFLETPCKLVRIADDGRVHHSSTTGESFPVYGQDGYPILIIGQASLDDLNSRMVAPIPMNRFRPNIVVSGVPAYAEDSWKRIRIGRVEIRMVKLCQRCPIPTTNQETGEQPENPWDTDPLCTLLTYRQVSGGGVIFGVNAINDNGDWVNLGDTVEILE